MLVAVEGKSQLGSFGQGFHALQDAIEAGAALGDENFLPLFFLPKADTTALASFFNPRALRQVDHFTRMALLGASLALQEAPEADEGTKTGIVLATGYGPAGPTFDFIESVLQYGENMVSPLAFSHSVQNIPAATLAKQLGFVGPCLTVCQPEGSFIEALSVASLWLGQGIVERVILVAIDEQHPLLPQVAKWQCEAQGIRAGDVLPGLGEGCAAFVLTAPWDGAKALLRGVPKLPENALHKDQPTLLSTAIPIMVAEAVKSFAGAAGYGLLPVAQALDVAMVLDLLPQAELKNPEANTCLCASIPDGCGVYVSLARESRKSHAD